jgi:hypothetical protein
MNKMKFEGQIRVGFCLTFLVLLVSSAVLTSAQDKPLFHVKSIHKEMPDEHGADKGSVFRYLKMVGTFDGKTYTVEAMDAGWTEALEVGKDYPAIRKKNDFTIESTFKGRPEKIHWRILTVEE